MKRSLIAITIVLLMALGAQVSLNTNSFPGFESSSDCTLCHNEPANAWNVTYATASITLDGKKADPFWSGETFGRRMEIPTATKYGNNESMIEVIFAQNDTYLFMAATWNDPTINGTDTIFHVASDGFSVMWNINSTDMNKYFGTGMKTNAVNQSIDTWIWKPSQADNSLPFNSTLSGHVDDTSFNGNGWVNKDASQDVKAAASHGYIAKHEESNYFVEFARPLVTNDPNDAQFNVSGYYEFRIAVFNDTSGISHMVSYPHEVYIYNPNSPPDNEVNEGPTTTVTKNALPWFTGYSLLAIVAFTTATIAIRNRKQKY